MEEQLGGSKRGGGGRELSGFAQSPRGGGKACVGFKLMGDTIWFLS